MASYGKIVVLSSLDGTRFDPYFDVTGATREALRPLVLERIPVVFFSSRTRGELEVIQEELGICHPFVAENGGALYIPQGYFGFGVAHSRAVASYEAIPYGRPYEQVVDALRLTAEELGVSVIGFNDMSVRDVAVDCGFSLRQARLAKQREYSEPFRITDLDPTAGPRLMQALRRKQWPCLNTGRYTLVSAETDQGAIVDLLLTLYRRAFGPTVTVGIGDPVTNLALLKRVDIPFIGTTSAVLRATDVEAPSAVAVHPHARVDALLEIVETLHASRNPLWREVRH